MLEVWGDLEFAHDPILRPIVCSRRILTVIQRSRKYPQCRDYLISADNQFCYF